MKGSGKRGSAGRRDGGFVVAMTLAVMFVVVATLAIGMAVMAQGASAAQADHRSASRQAQAVATWQRAGLPQQTQAVVATGTSVPSGADAAGEGESPARDAQPATDTEPSDEGRADADGQSAETNDPDTEPTDTTDATDATTDTIPAPDPTAAQESVTLERAIVLAGGKHFFVRVEYGPEAGIPAGARLSVAQVIETPEGYDPQKPEFKGRPAETEQFVSASQLEARRAELEKAVDVREGDEAFYTGFFALSLEADGATVQPAAGAKVKVTLETDAVAADEADHLRASFFTDKKPGAKHADALKLADRSADPAKDKRYAKGAKIAFEAEKLTELGLMGVTTAEELAEEARAAAEEAAAADAAAQAAGAADGTADESASDDAQNVPELNLAAMLAAGSKPPALAVRQYGLSLVAGQMATAAGDGEGEGTGEGESPAGQPGSYTVTWFDDDGDILETDIVAAGEKPSYDSLVPTKAATAQYTYAFIGWSNSLDGKVYAADFPDVTADVTYIATYAATVNAYTVVWTNDDGTVLETDEDVPYGAMPAYDGDTPIKDGYRFGLWDPEVEPVTGNVTYKAVFTQSPVEFLVRDHSTGVPVAGAHLALTNGAGVTVWQDTTGPSGIVWIKQVETESVDCGGAEFKPNSAYTLRQLSTDGDAYICPKGSWTLTVGADGETFALSVNAAADDMSTWRASGPYGARFYLDNVAASTIAFRYNYPADDAPSPEDETSSLPELSYDYKYDVKHEDPALDGYTFVGWQVDGTATYAHKGDVVTLDTLSRPAHTMTAQWRIPLNVAAYTYEQGATEEAKLVDGSEGAYAITAERSLTFNGMAGVADAYGQQNAVVHELGASPDYSFAFATLQAGAEGAESPAEPVRIAALQYDAAAHAWQYQAAGDATWVSIGKNARLNLYYTQDLVNVVWVREQEDGTFAQLDAERFPAGRTVAVSYDWAGTDALIAAADKPVVQGTSYYRYLGFGAADARSSAELAKAQLQSFSLKNSESGFLFSADGTGAGEPVAGDTIFVVYSETPPENSMPLAIYNHAEWPYRVNSLYIGGELAANDWLARGAVVRVDDDGTLQVMAAQDTVAAGDQARLVLLDAGAKAFVVDGGFAESAADGTVASVGVASSAQVARTTLVKASSSDNGLANTSAVTRGVLEAAPAEVSISFDSELTELIVNKAWSEDSFPDGFEVDLALYEDGKACAADTANARGLYTAKGAEWSIAIPALPARCSYSVSEVAVRNAAGADVTDDFQATYEDGVGEGDEADADADADDEAGSDSDADADAGAAATRIITVTNERTSEVCQVGAERFRTVRAAVDYIQASNLTTATIEMLTDYTMAESGSVQIPEGFDITLTSLDASQPKTITRGFAGAADMFSVAGTLTLENITLTGQLGKSVMAKDGNGGLVRAEAGAAITAGEGAQLTRGRAVNGSAIYAESGAVVNLAGARVTSCQAISGGAVGVADATCRVNVSGNTYIYGNHDGDDRDQYNIFLDQDSNEVIHVVDGGLATTALVGVRVPNGDASNTQYTAHGVPAAPFATFEAGADANLGRLSNDRLSGGSSKYGAKSDILANTVVWGETFSFAVNVQWLDDKFNLDSSKLSADAMLTLRLNGGYVTPGADTAREVQLSASDGWAHVFTGLAKYDGSGNPYKYTVAEASLPSDFKRVVFEGDKAVSGNELTCRDAVADNQDGQAVIISNYYRYTPFTVEKQVENLPAGQSVRATFAVQRVPKDGMTESGGIRYGGVGSVSDLPLALRGTEFTTEGGNRWNAEVDGATVRFHKFYDIAFGEFAYTEQTGVGTLTTGEWQEGDVVRIDDDGSCLVYAGGTWHALATKVAVSYLDFSRQDGNGGVEGVGGESAGKSRTTAPLSNGGSNPASETFTFSPDVASERLSSDYYYYVVETQVSESGGKGRAIADSHKLVATYDPRYKYDQLAQKVTVTNKYRDCLSVDKRWSDDVTNPGTCEFEVYQVLDTSGIADTAAYLDDPARFAALVKANFENLLASGKVQKVADASFSLPEPETGSWVHVLETLDASAGVYFARETRSGGIAIINPDVSDSSTSVDAVYSYDKAVNQITVKNLSGVLCKIDDRDGEHPFRTLNDALEYGRTRGNGESTTEFTIQMLRDYSIPANDHMELKAGERITLTTAATARSGGKILVYEGDAGKSKATIARKSGNNWPFVLVAGTAGDVSGTSITLENIELDGGGATVNFKVGNTSYYNGGLVYATNATVVLRQGGMEGGGSGTGAVMRNGRAYNGGAIYAVNSDVAISGAVFDSCASTDTNSSADRGGGAVWASGVLVLVEDTTFTDCTTPRYGGAIAGMRQSAGGADGETVTIRRCTFAGCTASVNGGGVYARSHTLAVEGCTFTSDEAGNPCQAGYRGGGIHHDTSEAGSATKVGDCSFIGCVTTVGSASGTRFTEQRHGGAGLNSYADELVLTDSAFQDCVSHVRGGGVLHFNVEPKTSDVRNCAFSNCRAETSGGGGMCLSALSQTVYKCTFTDCVAAASAGGGIDIACFEQDKDAEVASCEFVNCGAVNNNGGGISFGGRSLLVKDTPFTGCTAGGTNTANGGAISLAAGGTQESFVVRGCTFADCTARNTGGALYQSADYATAVAPDDLISGCTFTNCSTASGSGGAVYTNAVTLAADASAFEGCTGYGDGGAIRHEKNLTGTRTTLTGCRFSACESQNGSGGALWTRATVVTANSTPFFNCTARSGGGAVLHEINQADQIESSSITLAECTFATCTARGSSGGAVNSNAQALSIAGTPGVPTFANCQASGHGGAVYHTRQTEGSSATIDACSFKSCKAAFNTTSNNVGGALHTSATVLDIDDSTFDDCSTRSYGGAVYHTVNANYVAATHARIASTTFVNCESTNVDGGALYTNTYRLTLTDDAFDNCSARGTGGAVSNPIADGANKTESAALVQRTTFANTRTANGSAGALYSNAYLLTVSGEPGAPTFSSCTAGNGHGGAIYHNRSAAEAATVLAQCKFKDCTATRADSNNDARGGAVCTWAPVLDVQDAAFENCTSLGTGGALYQSGPDSGLDASRVLIARTTFLHCAAESASSGAVYANALALAVTGQAGTTTFEDCTAGNGHGGAIYHNRSNAGSMTTLAQCSFKDCTATRPDNNNDASGGAVCTWAAGVSLKDGTFENCTAKGSGGAVRQDVSDNDAIWPTSTLTAIRCSFVSCASLNSGGGALISDALAFEVNGGDGTTTFEGCSAATYGGAVYQNRNSANSAAKLVSCSFADCRTRSASSGQGFGGAVCVEARALAVEKADFDACSANYGGAVYSSRADVTMGDSNVRDCTAAYRGGGLYQNNSDSRPVTLRDSGFSGNAAAGHGGAVYFVSDNTLSLFGCMLSGNESGDCGGAVYFSSGKPLLVDGSVLSGNKAANRGGAVYFYSNSTVTLCNKTSITGNMLGSTTVDYAAGVYLHPDRSSGTLVLGAQGLDEDTVTVYDNLTSAEAQSNVRLNVGSYDNKAKRYNNRATSVSLLSNLVKPGVGATGSIGVANPGPENTQFGLGDVGGHTGAEYIVSDIDTMYGKLDPADHEQKKIIWYAPPICKITNQYGWPLYYGTDAKTAAFSSLKDAIEVLNDQSSGYLRDGDGVAPTQLQIQMLVPDYVISEAMPALKRDVTLSTANAGPGEYDYPRNATSDTATVTRGATATVGSMLTVAPGVSLTVKGITLDGGNRDEAPLVVPVNGGIIYAQSNALVTLTEGAVLRNSSVADGNRGGAVYVTGGTNPDVPALVMNADATVSNCSAGNGGAVYLTGGVLFEMNDAPHIEGCSASQAAGAVYVSPFSALSFADNANVIIRDNAVVGPLGQGAGIYLPDNNSKLYLRLGRMAVIADNYVLGTEDGSRLNGGDAYPLLRQDVFLGETGEPATSIVLTGDLAMTQGDIWVWAEGAAHYKTEMQFAVVATDASGNPLFTPRDSSLALLRNAQDDAATENDTDTYLYGLTEDGINVIWSYNTGSAKVILRKVGDVGGSYQSLPGATFTVYKGRSTRPYVVRHEDGTRETLSGLTSGDNGVFWIGTLPFGTYHLEETTTPAGYSASTRWFVLTIDESGPTMSPGTPTR